LIHYEKKSEIYEVALTMGKSAVVAIGGNAILKPNEMGTKSEQLNNIKSTTKQIAQLVKRGYSLVITHGNGPQVGNILLKNDMADGIVPKLPMDVCVAESQGQIGYMIQQSLINSLAEIGIPVDVTSLITQVLVDESDDAFENPTKPVGPYYPEDDAMNLAREKGWIMMEDHARSGYRRVVASPEPLEIIEKNVINEIINLGEGKNVVIALGGGGVPVIRTKSGLSGVEAVVDKDLASQLLASHIKADLLIMITDVEYVAINYGKPEQEDLKKITSSEARNYLKEGHFPPGSMGPKILTSIRFLESGGKRVVITTPDNLEDALDKKTGTHIVYG
jgi:carbamate kinase